MLRPSRPPAFLLALVLGGVVAVASAPATQAKRRIRVAEQEYSGSQGNDYFFTRECSQNGIYVGDDDTTILEFQTRRAERAVSLAVVDRLPGVSVMALVSQPHGNQRMVCGATDRAIPIRGGEPLLVVLYKGFSVRGPSYFTDGVVRATFISP